MMAQVGRPVLKEIDESIDFGMETAEVCGIDIATQEQVEQFKGEFAPEDAFRFILLNQRPDPRNSFAPARQATE